MRRTFVISDWIYRLSHSLKRNRFTVIVYALLCLLFLVVGITVGISVPEKNEFVLKNSSVIFGFLRGDTGIFAFFFIDFAFGAVYCLFAASMFFNRITVFLSVAPCAYRSYILGMNTSVIIAVYSVSAVPMLFVLFVPACVAEIFVLCLLSHKCFEFNAGVGGCSPSKPDLIQYYKCVLQYIFVYAVVLLVKSVTLVLFGSALVGIV